VIFERIIYSIQGLTLQTFLDIDYIDIDLIIAFG